MQAETRDDFLARWLASLVATRGLTSITDAATARAALVDDALSAVTLLEASSGAVIDVGSGGGSPGIPLAATFPDREFVLLEAARRKCVFLESAAAGLPNVRVVWGRAEEQPIESFGVALAKALAKPPVATELSLPLVRRGGAALVWVGPSADRDQVRRAASEVGGELEDEPVRGILRLRKVAPTPAGFPRRPGMAKKRPLG